ncbi:MAG: hypothetical protein WBB67_11860 [bacterium]
MLPVGAITAGDVPFCFAGKGVIKVQLVAITAVVLILAMSIALADERINGYVMRVVGSDTVFVGDATVFARDSTLWADTTTSAPGPFNTGWYDTVVPHASWYKVKAKKIIN